MDNQQQAYGKSTPHSTLVSRYAVSQSQTWEERPAFEGRRETAKIGRSL